MEPLPVRHLTPRPSPTESTPSHSRRLPLIVSVPMLAIMWFKASPPSGNANGESPGKGGYWQGVGELPRGRAREPTPDRHTPGTHWHLRARHARATDTLAHTEDTPAHARTRTRTHGHARAPRCRGHWREGGASHRAPAPGPGPCSHTGPAHSRNQISRTRPCSSHLTRSSSQSESFASVGWGPSTVPTLDSQVHRSESYSFTGSITLCGSIGSIAGPTVC